MIQMHAYLTLPEIVPQGQLIEWRKSLTKVVAKNCPNEVKVFITAMAQKLPDFERYQQTQEMIAGEELLLCGIKEWQGVKIIPFGAYPLTIPKMMAVDHETAMHRIFHKRGKQGLIDYVKARVKGHHLQYYLEIINVNVFYEERPEFKKLMGEIASTQKMEAATE